MRWRRIERVLEAVTGALEVERREKRIGGALEAAPTVWIAEPDLLTAFEGVDAAEVFRTSAAELKAGEGPADAFRLPGLAVAVEPRRAAGRQVPALMEGPARGHRRDRLADPARPRRRPGLGRRPWEGRMNPIRNRFAAYVVALLVIVVDQISKAWVLGGLKLELYVPRPVIPPIFNLTLVHNEGVSFGLLKANAELSRWALVLFSVVVAAGLAYWSQRVERPLTRLAIGLVMGGAVGNAVDRARLGHVTDFLDFSGLHFPWVFNGADSAISVGVAILLLEGLFTRETAAAAKAEPGEPTPP